MNAIAQPAPPFSILSATTLQLTHRHGAVESQALVHFEDQQGLTLRLADIDPRRVADGVQRVCVRSELARLEGFTKQLLEQLPEIHARVSASIFASRPPPANAADPREIFRDELQTLVTEVKALEAKRGNWACVRLQAANVCDALQDIPELTKLQKRFLETVSRYDEGDAATPWAVVREFLPTLLHEAQEVTNVPYAAHRILAHLDALGFFETEDFKERLPRVVEPLIFATDLATCRLHKPTTETTEARYRLLLSMSKLGYFDEPGFYERNFADCSITRAEIAMALEHVFAREFEPTNRRRAAP